jgi:nicotinamidase/pyrazinamidase
MNKKIGLIIVDCENDFALPGAPLYVPGGEMVVPEINRLREALGVGDVFLTQDWHPEDHISFVTQHPEMTVFQDKTLEDGSVQRMWPPHCVQGSRGAEFLDGLVREDTDVVVQKGLVRTVDSYSGFASNDGHSEVTGLEAMLLKRGITHVALCGLAFEYCVGFTALDAAKCGFEVCVVRSCTRGLSEADCASMTAKLVDTGKAVVVDAVEEAVAWARG